MTAWGVTPESFILTARGLPQKVLLFLLTAGGVTTKSFILTAGDCPLTVPSGMGTDTLAVRAAEGMTSELCKRRGADPLIGTDSRGLPLSILNAASLPPGKASGRAS